MDAPCWRAGPGQALLDLRADEVLARLADEGAVHLRGFARVREESGEGTGGASPPAIDFEGFTRAFGTEFVVHQRAARRFVSADGTTQTVTAGCDAVPLHRERSYLPVAPDLLFFDCVRPADDGGETLICDGIALAAVLPAHVREALAGRRLRCVSWSRPDEWGRSLSTTDRRAAAASMRRMLSSFRDPEDRDHASAFDGERLRLEHTSPCLRSVGGRPCFANFVLYYLFRDEGFEDALQITFDDGAPFPRELAAEIAGVAAPLTREVRWQSGDMLVVDNGRAMHGRVAFGDAAREIHVRMCYSAEDRRMTR